MRGLFFMNKLISKFKKASAGALAAAVVALGTSCGVTNLPPENTTASTQVTQNPNYPQIEDIKPNYTQGLLTTEQQKASIELNNVVKDMINEDRYYGSNFDYLVERLTITGINVEAFEPAQDYAVDYAPSTKSTVTIAYSADVVGKESGEKSTTANSISYVVDNANLALIAQAGLENADYVELTNAITTATEEKLENNQITEEDQVSGRQSNISDQYVKLFVTDDMLDYFYSSDELKYYLDNGYTLVSMFENAATDDVSRLAFSYGNDGGGVYTRYRILAPGMFMEARSFGRFTINFNFVTLATNEQTGDQKLLIDVYNYSTDINQEWFERFKEKALKHSLIDIERFMQENGPADPENGYFNIKTVLCGDEAYDSELYSLLEEFKNTHEFTQYSPYPTLEYDVDDVNSYENILRIQTLADENNENVVIREPSAENELAQ